jgi:hypothetical protein
MGDGLWTICTASCYRYEGDHVVYAKSSGTGFPGAQACSLPISLVLPDLAPNSVVVAHDER